ncbi:MAG: aminotransferase class I/II-fold pyridoxal phosphate-dependent enzyme, partial [Gammaproteobacteria bacterium]|nr:aminotransferase class I/II-fold pyridoxal phosphate-dependent enzyme [Gammaproteobacteria bacterium]
MHRGGACPCQFFVSRVTAATHTDDAATIDTLEQQGGGVLTVQTPGGTGALRVAADFIAGNLPGKRVWLSDPTWPNHPSIFAAAGVEMGTYPYFDSTTNGVNFDGMMAALREIPAGDIVLLHGCCH